jgi:hypothetical protein
MFTCPSDGQRSFTSGHRSNENCDSLRGNYPISMLFLCLGIHEVPSFLHPLFTRCWSAYSSWMVLRGYFWWVGKLRPCGLELNSTVLTFTFACVCTQVWPTGLTVWALIIALLMGESYASPPDAGYNPKYSNQLWYMLSRSVRLLFHKLVLDSFVSKEWFRQLLTTRLDSSESRLPRPDICSNADAYSVITELVVGFMIPGRLCSNILMPSA